MIESQKPTITTEPEIGSDGARHSKAEGAGNVAKATNPAPTLEQVLAENARLKAALEHPVVPAQTEASSIDKLAAVLTQALAKTQPAQVGPNTENIGLTKEFMNQQNAVDGRSLMETQAQTSYFRGEEKVPTSVPLSLKQYIGPVLSVTVNGVRIGIPVDGKTYFINATHAEHIKERIHKIENENARTNDISISESK